MNNDGILIFGEGRYMPHVAFLGGGNMAHGMVENLLRVGHTVKLYNRSKAKVKDLCGLGAVYCETPRLAAQNAQAVLSMVTGDEASAACWIGPDGALAADWAANAIGVESSTVSLGWFHTLSARALAGKKSLIDCPVAGRPDAAAAGSLTCFAGGSPEDVVHVAPFYHAFCSKIRHLGPIGSAISYKLIYNSVGAAQIAAVAEAMALCDKAGLNLEEAAAAFSSGSTGSPNVVKAVPYMTGIPTRHPPQFTGRGRLKDLAYAQDLATSLGSELQLGAAAARLFAVMEADGNLDKDDAALFSSLRSAP